MTAIAFNTLLYANKLKAAGVPEKQAEAQAGALAEILEDAIATKRDIKELEVSLKRDIKEIDSSLRKEMQIMKKDIIIWLGSIVVVAVGLLPTVSKLASLI
jgi:hypothetical protein